MTLETRKASVNSQRSVALNAFLTPDHEATLSGASAQTGSTESELNDSIGKPSQVTTCRFDAEGNIVSDSRFAVPHPGGNIISA